MVGMSALTSAGEMPEAWRRCAGLTSPWTGHRTLLRHDEIGGLAMMGKVCSKAVDRKVKAEWRWWV